MAGSAFSRDLQHAAPNILEWASRPGSASYANADPRFLQLSPESSITFFQDLYIAQYDGCRHVLFHRVNHYTSDYSHSLVGRLLFMNISSHWTQRYVSKAQVQARGNWFWHALHQIAYIWQGQWSPVKWLFMVNRYTTLFGQSIITFQQIGWFYMAFDNVRLFTLKISTVMTIIQYSFALCILCFGRVSSSWHSLPFSVSYSHFIWSCDQYDL